MSTRHDTTAGTYVHIGMRTCAIERCRAFVAGVPYGARWLLRFVHCGTGTRPHEDTRTFVIRSPLGVKVPTMAPPGYWAVLQAMRSLLA